MVISGIIKDAETHKPIEQVHVIIEDAKTGTISNSSGYYRLKLNKIPVSIVFTCVGYMKDQITITDRKINLYNVILKSSVNELKPVSIYAEAIINIIKDKPLYVTDYEFCNNNILLLAYRNKKISSPELILINTDGDTLISKPIMKAEKFYRDCVGNLHLETRKNAFQLDVNTDHIDLLYAIPLIEFHKTMDPIIASLNEKFYIHQYYYRNQVLQYYYFQDIDSSFHDFRVIEDRRGLRMLYDTDRWGNFGYTNEFFERFEDMCFADPIFAPLILMNDSLFIINFVDGQIESYSEFGQLINEVPINFHTENHWKEKLYIDMITGNVYVLFRKNGISTLKKINLKTGMIVNSITIPDFIFIENIKIRNNKVYFLYKENVNQEYKQLYKMNI
ncbi:carboxypeptidase-like regulatory domain-containing protein [candidate division KSB1 bacterium]